MTTSFVRSLDSVIRESVGKKGNVRQVESRAYMAFRFDSAVHADALHKATMQANAGTGAMLSQSDLVKLAAMDRRGYLHESEAAKVLADAQLRTFGSRPRGAAVVDSLRQWNGSGYITIGDTVVILAGRKVPAESTAKKKATRVKDAVPASLVQDARVSHARAIESRRAARQLTSGK